MNFIRILKQLSASPNTVFLFLEYIPVKTIPTPYHIEKMRDIDLQL